VPDRAQIGSGGPAVTGRRTSLILADNPLVRAVGRVPATLQRKLLVALVGTVALLVALGILGLRVLGDSNDRVDALGSLQQRASAYRELQTDSAQLRVLLGLRAGGTDIPVFTGAPAPPVAGSYTSVNDVIQSTLTRLGPATDVAGLGFVAPADEGTILSQIGVDYASFKSVMTQIIAFDNAGNTAQGVQLQHASAEPLANDLEIRSGELVTTTQRRTSDLIALNRSAFADSQHLFIGVAAGAVVLAMLLGFVLSWSLIGPIRRVNTGLAAIASGDFSGRVDVLNRDELGALAANVNRMNDQLARLYKELETASRHKSEFLANMSHELRTPLNAIIGFSEVLREQHFGDVNEKQAEYLTDIHTSGLHLLSLINDILDLSKIEAGRMELQISDVVLAELLENSVALMRERATRQGINLALQVDPAIGVIQADERRLKQVMFNLLTNAVKFTARGGRVDVAARNAGGDVVVSVSDDGEGIAVEDQARIFEEFEQAGGSAAQEGTGLGLPLSRRIVELHAGELTVESEPDKGSTFTFRVPRARTAVEAMDEAGRLAPTGSKLPAASPAS
jgi:signal transduction histidine kinase